MEGREGNPRPGAPESRDAREPAQWRWLAMFLAAAVHGPIVLLLAGSGWQGGGKSRHETVERMRITWSERPLPPGPEAAVQPGSRHAPALAVTPARPGAVRQGGLKEVDEARLGIPVVADDAWVVPAPSPAEGHSFRRDLFGPAINARPPPQAHLPRLQMHDSSLAGRWHEQARRIDCGELAAAMRAGSETLVGGGHGPGARRPMGGAASSETLLQSMKRRGCGR